MMVSVQSPRTLQSLDDATRALIRLAAVVSGGTEQAIRNEMASAHVRVPPRWTEELLLQSYLFAGFARALNAMREWWRYEPHIASRAEAVDIGALQALDALSDILGVERARDVDLLWARVNGK